MLDTWKVCQGADTDTAEGVGSGEWGGAGLKPGNRLSRQIMAKPTEHVKIKPQNIIMLRNAGLQRSLLSCTAQQQHKVLNQHGNTFNLKFKLFYLES